MEGISKILLTILGAGALSTFSYIIASRIGSKKNIIEAVHDIIQKTGMERVSKIDKEQEVVKKKIEESENLSEQARTEIIEIKERASTDIAEVLKKDKISDIQREINDEWENI